MNINWDNEVKYELKHLLWGTTYNPYAYCQLVYKKGDALYIHMFVEEKNPKAIYTKPNEPVYKDSCLECFLMLNDSGNYLNIEVNANGVMLMIDNIPYRIFGEFMSVDGKLNIYIE